ncbi:MAG: hypothetical protein KAJ01_07070 [Candidatus Hydrogenedentes bacterium]|nr:hypothetical protein [Candidatus Hydrogenedentota bacterium]
MKKSKKRKKQDRSLFGLGILTGLTFAALKKLYDEDKCLQYESENRLNEHCPISDKDVEIFTTAVKKATNPLASEKKNDNIS